MVRPEPWHEVAEGTWGDYLFTRQNPKGVHLERWVHLNGCRQWFNVARNTVTHEIVAVYGMTDPVPERVAGAKP
jgi:sarcosine oxidase subunit delta